jgi:hypothetical protein
VKENLKTRILQFSSPRAKFWQTTIDMNQDGYFEEGLKVPNMLQEFDNGTEQRPMVIVGL